MIYPAVIFGEGLNFYSVPVRLARNVHARREWHLATYIYIYIDTCIYTQELIPSKDVRLTVLCRESIQQSPV